jgi:hypothetical protein
MFGRTAFALHSLPRLMPGGEVELGGGALVRSMLVFLQLSQGFSCRGTWQCCRVVSPKTQSRGIPLRSLIDLEDI